MHYIVGTRFTVTPSAKIVRGTRDRFLSPGITYSLLNINKKDNIVVYKFKGSDGKIVEIEFPSCSDADIFISKYKNEKLPIYNTDTTEFFRLD